ncbi:DUF1289 domain-containing protein [Clostridiaceae bacterium 68-1-5]|uniref:DUF1289 domain-containing protein n=1 Tax=Suipraeoptans intestinalis TaxID=2606628 RepID=A0A6N7V069_9FIRM|nr:DUF1289 domain-containing protein [Suipraeoptans intestinalis]
MGDGGDESTGLCKGCQRQVGNSRGWKTFHADSTGTAPTVSG